MDDITNKINNTLRTKNSKSAYREISRVTILHPQKNDGGIMTAFIKDKELVVE